ncbi:MAG: hypothetical protein D6729_18750 [Deltaproteobacteria bacterium]|nr:MAG: hypothetical protein D6729_18750 [Deltaproteobacteria bacterium]
MEAQGKDEQGRERKIHETVDEYFNAIAPLLDKPHRRIDDREARMMGRAWDDPPVAHLIPIEAFKATGDIARFRELWEKRFGKERKPRPEYEPPEPEAADASGGESAATVH